MTEIAAANVTYSFAIRDRAPIGKLGYKGVGTIAFGNGSLTVPSAGIALTKASMLCPRVIHSLQVLGSNVVGYSYEFDKTNCTLKLCNVPTLTASGNLTATTLSVDKFTPTGNLTAKGLTLDKFTPTGNVTSKTLTIEAPTMNVANAGVDGAANALLWSNAGVLSHNLAAAASITGVQAPTGNVSNGHVTLQEVAATGNVANGHVTLQEVAAAGNVANAHLTVAISGSGAKLSAYTGAIASCILTCEVIGY